MTARFYPAAAPDRSGAFVALVYREACAAPVAQNGPHTKRSAALRWAKNQARKLATQTHNRTTP